MDFDPCANPIAGLNCDEAIHKLYHYLDGELTDERRGLIQHHLDACHHCVEAFEFELELRQVIARRCREEVPAELKDRIARLIAHEAGGSPLGGVTPRPNVGTNLA